MKISTACYVDLISGLFFLTGILSFVMGQFVVSTLLFAAATLTSLIDLARPARA